MSRCARFDDSTLYEGDASLTLEVTGADQAPNVAPALTGVRVDREVRARIAHHAEILHRRSKPHKRHTALTEGTSEPTQCSRTTTLCERTGDECTSATAARGGCVPGHEHAYRRALRHASLTTKVTGADETPNAARAATGGRVHRIVRVRVLHHTEMLHRRARPHKRHTALNEGTSEPSECSRTATISERTGDECTSARAARGGCVLGHEQAHRRALRHASLTFKVTGACRACRRPGEGHASG